MSARCRCRCRCRSYTLDEGKGATAAARSGYCIVFSSFTSHQLPRASAFRLSLSLSLHPRGAVRAEQEKQQQQLYSCNQKSCDCESCSRFSDHYNLIRRRPRPDPLSLLRLSFFFKFFLPLISLRASARSARGNDQLSSQQVAPAADVMYSVKVSSLRPKAEWRKSEDAAANRGHAARPPRTCASEYTAADVRDRERERERARRRQPRDEPSSGPPDSADSPCFFRRRLFLFFYSLHHCRRDEAVSAPDHHIMSLLSLGPSRKRFRWRHVSSDRFLIDGRCVGR